MTNIKLNAVIYVRVSSDDQAQHGFSISQQIINNTNYASENGYKIIQTFKDEGKSAGTLEREGLQNMLEYCSNSKNNVNAVIVYKLDRISRDVGDYSATLEPFFDGLDIELITVSDINGKGLDVKMMRQISMVFSERERKLGALRTKEGIRGKVATGQYPHHAPVGYKNIIKPGSKYKEMVIDEEKAFYIRQAYNMCLQGDSVSTIADKLYRRGLRNKNGNKHPKSTIEHVLKSIVYTGKFYYDDVLHENNTYPAIIDDATFYAVQNKLDAPYKTRQNHTEFPYNEVMKCAICGCQMTGERKVKKYKSGKTSYFIYYHCTGNRGGDCKKSSYIREEVVEGTITEILKKITIPEATIELVQAGLKEIHKQEGSDYEIQKNNIRKRVDKIDKMIKDAFESGLSQTESLKKNIKDWEAERKILMMEEHEWMKITHTFYEQSNSLLEFVNDCHSAFEGATAEEKRNIVKIVCSNLSYDGEKLDVVLHPAFAIILKNSIFCKKLPRLGSNQQPTG